MAKYNWFSIAVFFLIGSRGWFLIKNNRYGYPYVRTCISVCLDSLIMGFWGQAKGHEVPNFVLKCAFCNPTKGRRVPLCSRIKMNYVGKWISNRSATRFTVEVAKPISVRRCVDVCPSDGMTRKKAVGLDKGKRKTQIGKPTRLRNGSQGAMTTTHLDVAYGKRWPHPDTRLTLHLPYVTFVSILTGFTLQDVTIIGNKKPSKSRFV